MLRFQTLNSSFEREVELRPGQILLAICEPIQPWSLMGRSPEEDLWYIGVI
jgi:hypothetical protein